MANEESYTNFDQQSLQRIAKSVKFTENFKSSLPVSIANYSFELLVDASGGQAAARILSLDEINIVQPLGMLFYKWGVLDGARAGYRGDCVRYDGAFYFTQGPCIVKCLTDASLSSSTFPDGTVGEEYEHTVSVSDIVEDSIIAYGLPEGLEIDNNTGEITGTPTEAGEYFVIVRATGLKTGPGAVVEGATCYVTEGFAMKVVAPSE